LIPVNRLFVTPGRIGFGSVDLLFEPLYGFVQTLPEVFSRLPVQEFLCPADIRLPDLGIVHGQGMKFYNAPALCHVDYQFRQFKDRPFIRIPDIDRRYPTSADGICLQQGR